MKFQVLILAIVQFTFAQRNDGFGWLNSWKGWTSQNNAKPAEKPKSKDDDNNDYKPTKTSGKANQNTPPAVPTALPQTQFTLPVLPSLTNYKLTLTKKDANQATEITVPGLLYYRDQSMFYVNDEYAFVLRSPKRSRYNNGTFLTEVTDSGAANAWSALQGSHQIQVVAYVKKIGTDLSLVELVNADEPLKLVLNDDGQVILRTKSSWSVLTKVPDGEDDDSPLLDIRIYLQDGKLTIQINKEWMKTNYQFQSSSPTYFRLGCLPLNKIGEDCGWSEVWLYKFTIIHIGNGTITTTGVPPTTAPVPKPTDPTSSPIFMPSKIMDLSLWKLTLPIGQPKNPIVIQYPNLTSFSDPNYFFARNDCVVFIANCGGVTTKDSNYPRSEMREMYPNNTEASWSAQYGYHYMRTSLAVWNLPKVKPENSVIQIHDTTGDVIEIIVSPQAVRVRFFGLFAGYLDTNYVIGNIMTLALEVSNNKIAIYYQDMTTPKFLFDYTGPINYFKLGTYVQSNVLKGDLPTAFAETWVYNYTIQHS